MSKTVFECQSCGAVSPKWLGKCPDCGAWNSFIEGKRDRGKAIKKDSSKAPQSLAEITLDAEDRIDTGIEELNRVLGGGIVGGSLILIGGDPGIGKSTLVLQMLSSLHLHNLSHNPGHNPGVKYQTLYVSAEESPKQIRLRANRLNIDGQSINVLSETCLENIFDHAKHMKPAIVVVDSIQTVFTQEIPSAPGSVGQVRECALKLMLFAKSSETPVFLVGHVTKEGAIAGPRVLEHIVDTVLYFEGDRGHAFRILRAVKNRFGSTNEIGVFEMRDGGLAEITNPSELFLSERPQTVAGTTVVATVEGTRPIMVELQALVSQLNFGVPRRTTIGVDVNRVNLLIAVLEKTGGLHLGGMDVFLNVVGGLKVMEPAFDLGIVTTIASSFRELPIRQHVFVFGEVGLSGELRGVSAAEARVREGAKIGFKEVILPESNLSRLSADIKTEIKLTGVKDIDEAIAAALDI